MAPDRHQGEVVLSSHHPHILDPQSPVEKTLTSKHQDAVAFWFLGLFNNFGYAALLTGSFDMMQQLDGNYSTGWVLVADIVPTLFLPWFMHPLSYVTRVWMCSLLSIMAFLMVACSTSISMTLLGVVFASLSVGMGEVTFLAFTSMFHRRVISSWSSGLGAAGAIGSTAYLGLTMMFSPTATCLVLTIVPLGLLGCYYGLLSRRPDGKDRLCDGVELALKDQMAIIVGLLPYMIPLFITYFCEYTINQGVYEHLLFKDGPISPHAQFRAYQTIYELGAFAACSSLHVFPIKRLSVLASLQAANLVILAASAQYQLLPSFYEIAVFALVEGLLAGAVYVNAFALISQHSQPQYREFSMGIASMADALGIALAGVASIWLGQAFALGEKATHVA
eukprot:TRINITY_DN8712_c0_g1_i1.p1 TRINITY_DN8712_c0_g1~~TRINITY_DN8712_c0_g1_i1.p1  ORF type:complete len:392 (+),score=48.97 TRINITY_DN8712_c0_g1_i1:67-1242(+)